MAIIYVLTNKMNALVTVQLL